MDTGKRSAQRRW